MSELNTADNKSRDELVHEVWYGDIQVRIWKRTDERGELKDHVVQISQGGNVQVDDCRLDELLPISRAAGKAYDWIVEQHAPRS